ncbi:MAG: DNA polymerase III subunit delta [Candidatus Krumholzibacteria bacterium]|jgi:DNA polymerase III delta subunit|nr:DNA polymerase III subunit delta [Candidatus Krumholzibacteria bacterium]MDP6670079.1 DNA polymerase III subunit delta [Candidatus Krumholzibacteria bacterium]MDP7020876.1 DNA polymerase III subunit delta [Candidatus Krumholzibacteria bacterium]
MARSRPSSPLETLRADLKATLRPVYLFHGPEQFLIQEAVSLLRETLAAGDMACEFKSDTLGAKSRWSDIEPLLINFSMFNEREILHLDIPGKLSKDFRDSLSGYLESDPGSKVICLTAPSLDQLRAVKNRVEKLKGMTLSFQELKGEALLAWIRSSLAVKNVSCARDVPATLLALLPHGLSALSGEIEKLALIAREGEALDRDTVERIVGGKADLNVFRLVDALRPGNDAEFLRILGEFLDSGAHKPVSLLPLLGTTVRNLLKARILLDSNSNSPASVEKQMGLHPYLAKKTVARAQRGSRSLFLSWLLNLQKLDVRLKRSPEDRSRILMETYLLESLSGRFLSS